MTRARFPSLKSCRRAAFVLAGAFLVTSLAAQDYVTLAKGGGVTGNTTSFRISRSGEVARGTGSIEPSYSAFAHLRKSKAKKYFRKTRALIQDQAFIHPGNTYTSITLVERGIEGKVVWGDVMHKTPAKAAKLYQKIHASLNRLTFGKELRK